MTLTQLISLVIGSGVLCCIAVCYALWVLWRVVVQNRVDTKLLHSSDAIASCFAKISILRAFTPAELEESYGDASRASASDALNYQAERFVSLAIWLGPMSKLCMFLGLVAAFAAMHWQNYGEHGVLGLSRAAVEAKALYWGLIGLTTGATTSSLLLAWRKTLGRQIEDWRSETESLLERLYPA